MRKFKSLVTATTSDNIHLCPQQLVETLYISVPTNYLGQCIFQVPANNWESVHLFFQQPPEKLYISGRSN